MITSKPPFIFILILILSWVSTVSSAEGFNKLGDFCFELTPDKEFSHPDSVNEVLMLNVFSINDRYLCNIW